MKESFPDLPGDLHRIHFLYALLSFLIHFEMKQINTHKTPKQEEPT